MIGFCLKPGSDPLRCGTAGLWENGMAAIHLEPFAPSKRFAWLADEEGKCRALSYHL